MFGEGVPGDARAMRSEPALFDFKPFGGGGESYGKPAVADDLRGDAHAEVAGLPGIVVNGDVRVRMNVDESRRNILAGRVDKAPGNPGQIADSDDSVVTNPDVCTNALGAAAIVDGAARNHEVVFRCIPIVAVGQCLLFTLPSLALQDSHRLLYPEIMRHESAAFPTSPGI
jgi:hypothetical protein